MSIRPIHHSVANTRTGRRDALQDGGSMSNPKLSEIRKRHDKTRLFKSYRKAGRYLSPVSSLQAHKDREYLLGLIARMEPFVGWTGANDDLLKELEQ